MRYACDTERGCNACRNKELLWDSRGNYATQQVTNLNQGTIITDFSVENRSLQSVGGRDGRNVNREKPAQILPQEEHQEAATKLMS